MGDSSPVVDVSGQKSRRPLRWRRLTQAVIVFAALLGVAELVARFLIGLGDPPLMCNDPQIEYIFLPSRTYSRFHNRIHYNAYSMRSNDFPAQKADPRELRVLVLGDSIINGGNLTDQKDLATDRLRPMLEQRLHRPVVVGNVSAGSWGVPNLLAYARRFGWFEADVVVLVLSRNDMHDVPTYSNIVGKHARFPDRSPIFALQEAFDRYAPILWYAFDPMKPITNSEPAQAPSDNDSVTFSSKHEAAQSQVREALKELVASARANGAQVLLVIYPELNQLNQPPDHSTAILRSWAEEMDLAIKELGPAFESAMSAGEKPYRDPVHPSPVGQRLMAEAIADQIVHELDISESKSSEPHDQ